MGIRRHSHHSILNAHEKSLVESSKAELTIFVPEERVLKTVVNQSRHEGTNAPPPPIFKIALKNYFTSIPSDKGFCHISHSILFSI